MKKVTRLIFMLTVFSFFGVSGQIAVSEQRPKILWKQEVGFQPIDIQAGDLNGDSRPDMVIGGSLPAIIAIDSTGDVLWRFKTQAHVWRIAIGDINGDGKNDVAGVEPQSPFFLYAIDSSGAQLWSYQLPTTGSGSEWADHMKIGDVDGDGDNEVVVGTNVSGRLLVFDSQGIVVLDYSVPPSISSVELADLNGDDAQDVVISYGSGIQAIDGTGTLLWDFPTQVRLGDAAVGDINNDGKPDVVVVEFFGNKVHAIDNAGSLLWTFQQQGDTGSVILGDISGNGKLDVVVGSQDGQVYLIEELPGLMSMVTWKRLFKA